MYVFFDVEKGILELEANSDEGSEEYKYQMAQLRKLRECEIGMMGKGLWQQEIPLNSVIQLEKLCRRLIDIYDGNCHSIEADSWSYILTELRCFLAIENGGNKMVQNEVRQERAENGGEFKVTDEAELLKEQIAKIRLRLKMFCYVLLRDYVPAGSIEEIWKNHVVKAENKEMTFYGESLTAYAQDLADRLIGDE